MIIGFLGVGTISTAVIRAMSDRPVQGGSILLSPRSEHMSTQLAAEFPHCRRMASNQEVVDESDMVVLAMRPQQLDEALSSVRFRDDQVVASFIAGTPPSQIAALVSPASRVAQLIPLPAIELGRGPLLICPAVAEVERAFEGLGDVIVWEDESRIRVFSCASAFMSTYYELQNTIIGWMSTRGIDEDTAARYILSELEGLAAVGKATPVERLGDLPGEHQTRGGLNERVRRTLGEQGWFGDLASALDDVYDNAVLRSPDPTG